MAAAELSEKLGNLSVRSNGGGEKSPPLSREQREAARLSLVGRKKDFKHVERVGGRLVNVLEGLELHTGVFSAAEQQRIVECVYDFQDSGRKGLLKERTYSEPRKWMRGKGRATIQFGCCYNYATDKKGNPPGIIQDEEVDSIPPLLKSMIKRMVEWHVLPSTCIPNSCIINIYEKDDCIPPHIDHHDFLRPFCTVSFLTESNIVFGQELKVLAPGEFSGSASIPLPVGSVLVLKGNGADVAKHCIPAVPAKRISITFRKMDDRKLPFRFVPDPELQNLRPLPYPSVNYSTRQAGSASMLNGTNRQQASPRQGLIEQAPAASAVSPTSTTRQQATPQHAPREQTPRDQAYQASFRDALRQQTPLQDQATSRVRQARENSSNSFNMISNDFPPLGTSPASGPRSKR